MNENESTSPDAILPAIYVAEDNDDDLFMLRRRLGFAGIQNPVVTASNGQAALAMLETAERDALRPALILLDINMPRVSGFEVLKWIRSRDHFRGTRWSC